MKRPPRKPPTEARVNVPEGQFEPEQEVPGQPLGPLPAVFSWKTELTKELVDQLCVAAAIGGFKRQTALACGVKPELLEWWLSEGMREDAEPLMSELSVRFLSTQENATLGLVEVIRRAAALGEWDAALCMLKLRDPLWRGSEKFLEQETAPPTSSLKERKNLLVEELKHAKSNPHSPLAAALREAGFDLPNPELDESNELRALLVSPDDSAER